MNAASLQTLDMAQPYISGVALMLGGEAIMVLIPLAVLTLCLVMACVFALFKTSPVQSVVYKAPLALGDGLKESLDLVHSALDLKPHAHQKKAPLPALGPAFFEGLAERLGAVQEPVMTHDVKSYNDMMRLGENALALVRETRQNASVLLVELDGWRHLSTHLGKAHCDDALGCLTRAVQKCMKDEDHLGFVQNGRLLALLHNDDGARAENSIQKISEDLSRHSLPLGATRITLGANAVYAILYEELGEFGLITEALVQALEEESRFPELSAAS